MLWYQGVRISIAAEVDTRLLLQRLVNVGKAAGAAADSEGRRVA